MHNTLPENVAEHSLMTAYFAHALAIIRRDIFDGEADPNACAVRAMFHDCAEIFTGDMPTPVKYWSESIRNAYREVEEHSAGQLLSLAPVAMQGELASHLDNTLEDDISVLVHAADKLSAYVKCIEETRLGNSEFKRAGEQTLAKLHELEIPEVEYFIKNFLPSFVLTLDELR